MFGRNCAGLTRALLLGTACLAMPTLATATTIDQYLIIGTADPDNSEGLIMSDSELGAIDSDLNNDVPDFEDPKNSWSVPDVPSNGIGPSQGIFYDGDVAITTTKNKKAVTFSNSIIHAEDAGPGNEGSQGVDCGASFNSCTSNGGEISSNNLFNEQGESVVGMANNKGIQGNVDHSLLLSQLAGLRQDLWDTSSANNLFNAQTSYQTLSVGSKIEGTRTDTFGGGLHFVDINTSDTSKLLVQNGSWIVDGLANTYVVFRLPSDKFLDVSQANLVIGDSGIGTNNILFLVDADQGVQSFNFDNVRFNGFSFWDYEGLASDNETTFNNVLGCGSLINDKINLQNVGMSRCAFDTVNFNSTVPVPVPASLPLLVGGIGVIAMLRRRRTS